MNMTIIDTEAFKKAGLTEQEIESVKRWLEDVKIWKVYTEDEFYSSLENRLFSKQKTYV